MGTIRSQRVLFQQFWNGASSKISESYLYNGLRAGIENVRDDTIAMLSMAFLFFLALLSIFGTWIAPYSASESIYVGGELLNNHPPSIAHPLGTNTNGQDILSRVIIGARPTLLVGFGGGFLIAFLGTIVGVTAGYKGGRTENVLMRITDLAYGVPLIPIAIVILAILGQGLYIAILLIGLILWRSSARILRSKVLQIKERPFILAAKTTGASDLHIILRHILPNIFPLMFLFFATGVGYSILLEAGLTFIGVTDPFRPSWAVMLRNAYNSGYMGAAWWWTLPPGFLISFTTLSVFMLGRSVEDNNQIAVEG